MDIFPADKGIIEATYRLASTGDGKKHHQHLLDMLAALDVASRTALGDQDLINKGKRQCLAELIRMLDEIPTVMKERMVTT